VINPLCYKSVQITRKHITNILWEEKKHNHKLEVQAQ